MLEIILTLLVSSVFIVFAVFIIILLSKNTTKAIAEKTVELVSVYDELLNNKSEELEKAREELQYIEEKLKNCSANEQGFNGEAKNEQKVQDRRKIRMAPSFLSDNFCDSYNAVRENFECDLNEIISKHPEISRVTNTATDNLKNFYNEIPFETFYDMSFLQEEEQISLIKDACLDDVTSFVSEYIENSNSFNSLDFYTYLCDVIEKDEQYFKIRVSPNIEIPKDFVYDVQVDDSICEGVQVEINHKLFDYSINKKEIDSHVSNK